jgi:heme exporter protein D
MSDFLNQGGYGFYVWSSYGISAIGLGVLIVWTVASWRKAKARLQAMTAGNEELQ